MNQKRIGKILIVTLKSLKTKNILSLQTIKLQGEDKQLRVVMIQGRRHTKGKVDFILYW